MNRGLRLVSLTLGLGAIIGAAPARAHHQDRFRSSLTATVIIPAGSFRGKTDPLGCLQVALRWVELRASRRYRVYVAARSDGPWSELPARNVCGEVRWTGATGLTDVEPTTGAATVVHRLYYKVIAFAGTDAGAATLDVTDPVSVPLP